MRHRTPRGEPLRVRLYEKDGCGLCAEAYRALTRVRMSVPLEIERVDIEKDPELFRRYAIRIPVLEAGGRQIDAAGADETSLKRWFEELIAAR